MASTRQTFQIEGLKELGESLDELNTATAKGVLRRVLQTLADSIIADAKSIVRRDTGGLKKSIRRSAVKFTKGAAGKAAFAEAMRGGATRAEAGAAAHAANAAAGEQGLSAQIVLGPDQRPYAHMVEFGTAHMGARPYMRPAWDRAETVALGSIADELGREIKKAADRAARKAARILSKIKA